MLTAVWMALSFRMLHPFLNMGPALMKLPFRGKAFRRLLHCFLGQLHHHLVDSSVDYALVTVNIRSTFGHL